MSTITTRAGKGSPLTNNEVDANFTNLNTDKAELSGATFTGEITANGGIALGDNDKATFGASDDLQIYHDGSHSYIKDAGSGILYVQGSGQVRVGGSDGTTGVEVNEGGNVKLRYNNANKLSTTSTGIDVTGTATMDGLTFGANNRIQGTGMLFVGGSAATVFEVGAGSEKMRLTSTGLGIGTSSPDTQLTLYKASTNADVNYAKMRMDSWGGSTGKLKSIVWDDAGTAVAGIGAEYDGAKTNIHFHSQYNGGFKGTADRTMSIMGNGRVGIGTSSPDTLVHAYKANNAILKVAEASGYASLQQSGVNSYLNNVASGGSLIFRNGSAPTERMRIDSSGNVGIGTSSPNSKMSITGFNEMTLGFPAVSGGASRSGIKPTVTGAGEGQLEFLVGGDNNNEATTVGMAIDSSGNVGIGTSSTPQKLTVSGNATVVGSTGIQVATLGRSNNNGALTLNNSGGVTRVKLNADGTDNYINAGNLLVGTTSAYGTTGTTINAAGLVYSSADGDRAGQFDRTTSDGELVRFSKAGTTVGSIGTVNGDMYLGTGDTGLFFSDGANYIMPYNVSTPGLADGLLDLGRDTNRFKELYLSGTLHGDKYDIYTEGGGSLYQTNGYLRFANGNTETARIDSSGNLLVGTTSQYGQGLSLNANATAYFRKAGDAPLTLRRDSTDGSILNFYKDGAAVGSIGTVGGATYYGGTTKSLRINTTGFHPATNTGAYSDNTVSLGHSGGRFKDLYLSGGVYLGGTGSANKLDDYEEGAWTPSLVGSTTAGTATFVSGPTGTYTKIGNQVTVYFDWNISAHTGTGALRVNGLPFTKGSAPAVGAVMDGNYSYTAGRTRLVPYIVGSVLRFYGVGDGVGYAENVLDVAHQINGSVTYTV